VDRVSEAGDYSRPVGKYPKVTDCDFSGAETDGALMARVAAGDRQAFGVLYRRYAPILGRYLLRLLKSRELTEEALNDVMLASWHNAGRFDSSYRLSSWLFGIAHKKGLKTLKRASRQSAGPDDGELEELARRVSRTTRRTTKRRNKIWTAMNGAERSPKRSRLCLASIAP